MRRGGGALPWVKRPSLFSPFGPTDAWATLAKVTLTNMFQLNFDMSTVEQPPRLYPIVPLP
ncbi:hypothetical protein SBV1_810010 [Verrucomicrobia bacterium]|nr:hypothetical protein SBV1_810010 [Verrucomicrobiota bacterium]